MHLCGSVYKRRREITLQSFIIGTGTNNIFFQSVLEMLILVKQLKKYNWWKIYFQIVLGITTLVGPWPGIYIFGPTEPSYNEKEQLDWELHIYLPQMLIVLYNTEELIHYRNYNIWFDWTTFHKFKYCCFFLRIGWFIYFFYFLNIE